MNIVRNAADAAPADNGEIVLVDRLSSWRQNCNGRTGDRPSG